MAIYKRLLTHCVLLLSTLALVGCDDSAPPPNNTLLGGRIGDLCLVYFRRDALGMAADIPSEPTTGNLNGADLSLTGKLVWHNAEWLIIRDGNREFSIPTDVILMIQVVAK